MVVGTLVSRDDTFITQSGCQISLHIWALADDISKNAYAMYSIKVAMKYDEDVFGLNYDFYVGGMENTNLNIFNTQLVLIDFN